MSDGAPGILDRLELRTATWRTIIDECEPFLRRPALLDHFRSLAKPPMKRGSWVLGRVLPATPLPSPKLTQQVQRPNLSNAAKEEGAVAFEIDGIPRDPLQHLYGVLH